MSATSGPTDRARRDAPLAGLVAAARALLDEVAQRARTQRDEALLLREIAQQLGAIAARPALLPPERFALPPGARGCLFEILCDGAESPALYLSHSAPGGRQPAHNHGTWAVIAGVAGREIHRLYALDAHGRLQAGTERAIDRGDTLALGTHAFHALTLAPDTSSFHLHCYGRRLDGLGPVAFAANDAGDIEWRTPTPAIASLVLTRAERAALAAHDLTVARSEPEARALRVAGLPRVVVAAEA